MTTATTAPRAPGRVQPSAAHRLVISSSIIAMAADLVWMVIIGVIIPPLAIFAVLTVALAVASRRWPRAAVIGLGLQALLALGGGLEFLRADLSSPSDPFAFLWAVLSGGGRVVVLVGVLMALRNRDLAARRFAVVSLAVLGLAVAGSLLARLTVPSDARQADDVEVVTERVAFPEQVDVPAGGAVLVDNRDPVRHTFTVADTDVDVLIEPGVRRRIPIALAPGTYELICLVPGHESMTGTLEVVR